jgi:hypothetical protein
MTGISFIFDRVLSYGLKKAGPSGTRVELGFGAKQLVIAAGTAVNAVVLAICVFASKGRLCCLFATHCKLVII